MLGLVRSAAVNPFSLTTNHQVLGYAYEAGPARATIRIYDPNHHGRDDVAIRMRIGGVATADDAQGESSASWGGGADPVSLGQSTGEPLLALLHLPYRPASAR
jgi:hypothetical protein